METIPMGFPKREGVRSNDLPVLIPVRSGEESSASWRLQGKTLLERALERAEAVSSGSGGVFVAGRGLECFCEAVRAPGVAILDVDLPPLGARGGGGSLEGLRAATLVVAARRPALRDGDGLVFLDPFRPLVGAEDVREVVACFQRLGPERLAGIGVTSVSRLRNHHHPKKVLRMLEDRGLTPFQEEGRRVFQRQQLAGDDYYIVDPAVAVVGPDWPERTGWDPAGWVAVPIRDHCVRVESLEELRLAEALEQSDTAGGRS